MEELLNKVEELNANVPEGIVKDADTILVDMVQENDFEITGIAQDILIFGETVRTRKQLSRCSLSLQIWNLKIFLKNAKKK